ncbi:MAG: cupin domain-containing protein [Planctomycetota bacterium]|nr:cupin domain-containing protein [Planctomycetota bacterium]
MDSNARTAPPLDLTEAFARIEEHWRPRVAASWNGQAVKLVKFRGEFVWHRHEDADELFLVWRGRMRLEFRDGVVTLAAGQLAVVPRGVEHRTSADEEVEVLVLEPADVRNTGDVLDARLTAPRQSL